MAQLLRFVVDAVVTDDEDVPNQYRQNELAKELSDNLHISIAEPEDGFNLKVEKLKLVHVHDTADGSGCRYCQNLVYDERNGDTVLAEAEDA